MKAIRQFGFGGPEVLRGGYAERAVAPVASLHELPEGVDPAEAVAMIGTGRTALLLLDQAALRADDVVLVPAAAGGLGARFLEDRALAALVDGSLRPVVTRFALADAAAAHAALEGRATTGKVVLVP